MAERYPFLIGLCGHMGVGKDSAAALLAMVGYERIAFADEVRSELLRVIAGDRLIPPEAFRDGLAEEINQVTSGEVWAKPTGERMRRILQWWGSEYRRAQDPDYWVKSAMARLKPEALTAISDVRFPNEVRTIRERGGVVWKIVRPVQIGGIKGHISESCIEQIEPDLTISNTGTLLDLAAALRQALG